MDLVKLILGFCLVGVGGSVPSLVKETSSDSIELSADQVSQLSSSESQTGNEVCNVEWISEGGNFDEELKSLNTPYLNQLGINKNIDVLSRLSFRCKEKSGLRKEEKNGYFTLLWRHSGGEELNFNRYEESVRKLWEEICRQATWTNNVCNLTSGILSVAKRFEEGINLDTITINDSTKNEALEVAVRTFDWVWIPNRK